MTREGVYQAISCSKQKLAPLLNYEQRNQKKKKKKKRR